MDSLGSQSLSFNEEKAIQQEIINKLAQCIKLTQLNEKRA